MADKLDLYIFTGEVAPKFSFPASMTRWDQSTAVTTVASNRDEAFLKMKDVMGTPPKDDVWVPRITSIEPLMLGVLK